MRWTGVFLLCLMTQAANAQTTKINGSSFAYRSSGSTSGSSSILDRDGMLGTYVTLTQPGNVTIAVSAQGTASGGIDPNMNVVLADNVASFDVTSGSHSYSHTFALPAGTFFLRTEFNNDVAQTSRSLKVDAVSITGASVSNAATSTLALAASDTYIANYRKGNATVDVSGLHLPAGTQIGVSLKNIDFHFGTAVPGGTQSEVASYVGSTGTVKQKNYQAALLQNFNSLTPENSGKWANDEATRGKVTMGGVDAMLSFADQHDLYARLHNIFWDSPDGSPTWLNTLRSKAVNSSSAKTDLTNAVTSRINYYLPSRAAQVGEVDVYNESFVGECCAGNSSFWKLYGPKGLASFYNAAAKAAPGVKMMTNEEALDHNQFEYFNNIEELRAAGAAVGGIGVEDYPTSFSSHNPSNIIKGLQTYDVTGLPQTLTEFGVFGGVSAANAATILSDTLRLEFGNANSTGFFMWGFQSESGGGNLYAPAAALYTVSSNGTYTLTAAGKAWQSLMKTWTTQTTAAIDATGKIAFNGYYGDYQLTAGGKVYLLSFDKGTNTYKIGSGLTAAGVPEPSALALASLLLLFLPRVRRVA